MMMRVESSPFMSRRRVQKVRRLLRGVRVVSRQVIVSIARGSRHEDTK